MYGIVCFKPTPIALNDHIFFRHTERTTRDSHILRCPTIKDIAAIWCYWFWLNGDRLILHIPVFINRRSIAFRRIASVFIGHLIDLLPNRKHCVIRSIFIRRNLCYSLSSSTSKMECIIIGIVKIQI